jgi:hypothetical protein
MPSSARSYARFFGVVYLLVALLELIFKNVGNLIVYSQMHNIIHWGTGIIGLICGYGAGGKWARTYAQVFGTVFAIVTILGLFAPEFLATIMGGYRVNWLYNVIHAITAIGGLWTGFSKKKS